MEIYVFRSLYCICRFQSIKITIQNVIFTAVGEVCPFIAQFLILERKNCYIQYIHAASKEIKRSSIKKYSVSRIQEIYYCVYLYEFKPHRNFYFMKNLFFFADSGSFIEAKNRRKVRKFKDFYEFTFCSNVTVSTVLSLSQSNSYISSPLKNTGNLNFRLRRILPPVCSSS